MTSKVSKLHEVAEVIDSLHKTPKYSEIGKPMVRCTDVRYGKLSLKDTLKVADNIYNEFSRRYSPKKDDIVITRVGTYGVTAQVVDTNFCLGQNTSAIVPQKIDARYLYLALNSPFIKNQIEFSVVGSTQKTLSLKAINNLEIPRFDPEIEAKIGIVGANFDDKIELNRQINQTLEAMARAIFKSWFVDFDPVKAKIAAKAAGRDPERAAMLAISGKTQAQFEQLTAEQKENLAHIAALFPDEMQDSELGEIPRGWEVSKIGAVAEFAYGKSLKASNRKEGNVPVYGSNGQTGFHNEALVEGPGIIIGRKGNPGIVTWSHKDFFPIDTTFYVKRTGIISSLHYLFFSLKEQDLPSLSADSAVPGLNRNIAYMNNILIPSDNVIEKFENICQPIFNKMNANENEIELLGSLRDTLLPKLLSGEIELPVEPAGGPDEAENDPAAETAPVPRGVGG